MGAGHLNSAETAFFLLARALPLIVWTVVLYKAKAVIKRDAFSDDTYLRRLIVVWIVEGACIGLLAGGLARVGLVSGDVASLIYTVLGAVVVIVGITLLITKRP